MAMVPLKIPIGQSDFRRVIQEHYYFVDKSLFIKAVLEDSASVLLMTRPRRFGKTLNLSMLRYFFASTVDGEPTAGLFDGLQIQNDPELIRQHQGRYPVIFLTLKDLKFTTFDETYRNFSQVIAFLYREHRYLLSSDLLDPDEKKDYQALLERKATPEVLSYSLKSLSAYLYRYHKTAPVILIDEYDTPIQSGYLNDYYPEVVSLFRGFLGAALKDNPYCAKAVLTGILRVSKESLFSGLNNLAVYSVLNSMYGEYFGFTDDEVQCLLERSGLSAHTSDIRRWYNGYQIGPHTIYNPWSLLNCVREQGELKQYWLNTSDNLLVRDCLYRSGIIHQESLEQLLQGHTVDCLVNEHTVFPDLQAPMESEGVIFSFLLMAGYLKAVSVRSTEFGTECRLAIPNIEIRSLYRILIKKWLTIGKKVGDHRFLEDLLCGNLAAFEQSFRSLLENTISVHDLAKEPEAFYHGFMTGLTAHLQSHPDYELKSNRESGYGRYDYLILSRVPEKPSVLMEFKRVQLTGAKTDSLPAIEAALETAAQQALTQIDEKGYMAEARLRGSQKILRVALAFCGKHFKLLALNSLG